MLMPQSIPKRLAPDHLAEQLRPFDTWPKDGSLPDGFFQSPVLAEAAAFHRENGYVVLHAALSNSETEALRIETSRLCRNDNGLIDGIEPASIGTSDTGAMTRVLCVHFPHKLSELINRTLSHSSITDILKLVIGPNVKCMQSMLFVKAAGKPGQAWHQDEDFIPTRDRSLTGAWISLDDATIKNGCLWVLPKSHQRGVLWPQRVHFDNRFDCTHESWSFPWNDADSVPIEVKAGSIVLFNGYLLHRSLPNTSHRSFRRALVGHYMSAESLLPWMKPDERTSMALADYRDIVMVAGEDPYAYKGIEDVAKAFVRPDVQGGCVDWNDDEQKKKAAEHARAIAEVKEKCAGSTQAK
jgi:ectoine hydroxylase-related dioxygenase (phytanoyl-CoA dioxygenase family)